MKSLSISYASCIFIWLIKMEKYLKEFYYY